MIPRIPKTPPLKKQEGNGRAEDIAVQMKRGGANITVIATRSHNSVIPAKIHYHSAVEFHIVERGSFHLFTETQIYDIDENMTCVVGPNAFHYLRPRCADCAKYELRFEFSGKRRQNIYAILPDREITFFDCMENTTLARRIFEESNTRRGGWLEAIHACLDLIWISAARKTHDAQTERIADESVTGDNFRGKIASDFFSDHYSTDLKPRHLSKLLSVSERQLDRILKQQTGMSFSHALIKARMEAAKYLLRSADMTIDRVSELVGYHTPSGFYRAFREYEGMTPDSYKTLNKKVD
ncbi:MAG: AraC family transcriptional regulator [Synergistaceae bacterium]|nr:AraC family transcriptional regulator [Synergistaceae bacterium]